jgi:hypothetical protein
MRDPDDKRWTLSAAERAVLAAAADAFFPPSGPIPLSGCDAHVVEWFDGYVGRAHAAQAVLMRLLFAFTELSPLVFGPERGRFTRISQEGRIAFLARENRSRIYFRRVAFISLRAMMTMAYLSNARVSRYMNMNADTDPFGLDKQPSVRPNPQVMA